MSDEDKKTTDEEETESGKTPGTESGGAAAEAEAGTGSEVAGEQPAGAGGEPHHMDEEELRKKLEEHFREQNVSDVLVQFLISLSTLAYVKMGLTDDSKEYKDLEQASLAIDSFRTLLEALENRLPEQDAKALAGALASMQITFAKASSGSKS